MKTQKTIAEPRKWRSIAVSVLTHSPFQSGRDEDLNPIQEEMRRQAILLYEKQGAECSKGATPAKRGLARATHL